MGIDPKLVTSVSEYIEIINTIIKRSPECKLIFRGQDKLYDSESDGIIRYIKSGATRRLQKYYERANITNDELYYYTVSLLYYSMKKRYNIQNNTEFRHLELLAELQHFGAATILIDFSKNALVALYFACVSEADADGSVFLMDINDKKLFTEAKLDQFNEEIEYSTASKRKDFLALYFSDIEPRQLFFWEPSSLNLRIPAQHSVFVFGKPEIFSNNDFIDIVKIDKSSKGKFLEELDNVYNINDYTIYNDLPGFAYANSSISKIDKNKYLINEIKDMKNGLSASDIHSITCEIEEIKKLDKQITGSRESSLLYLEKGNIEFRNNKLIDAGQSFTEAINSDPTNEFAYYFRGILLEKIGKEDASFDDYSKAIEIYPEFPLALNNRGNIYLKKMEIDKAINDFSLAIELDINHQFAYYNRGRAYLEKCKFVDSVNDFTKAIDLNKNDRDAYILRAYANIGNYSVTKKDSLLLQCEIDLEKAKNIDPNHPNTYAVMALMFYKKMELDKALVCINKSISLNANYGEAYYIRSIIKKETGSTNEAEADHIKSLDLKYSLGEPEKIIFGKI